VASVLLDHLNATNRFGMVSVRGMAAAGRPVLALRQGDFGLICAGLRGL